MANVGKISLCSNALIRLGAKPINDLSEDNDRVRLVNLYDNLRDSLLRSHVWNCAVKRVTLSPSTTLPAFGFQNQFLLPDDCLRTLQVGEPEDNLNYKLESGYILADTDVVKFRYIWRNQDESTWDAMLIEGMELTLAHAFAYPITQSTAAKQDARDELVRFLKTAMSVDGVEEPGEDFGDSYLIGARHVSR